VRLLIAIASLFAGILWNGAASAHEVRPAYLEITQRQDGKVDVLWKLPTRGEVAVSMTPEISGRLLAGKPTETASAEGFEIRKWGGLPVSDGINGRTVHVAGLEHTITDVLLLIRLKNGDQVSHILTPAKPSFVIDTRSGTAVSAYLTLGIEHILTGIDHLLFVFGLMLLSRRLSTLLRTITAFTAAHSITLIATALRVINPNPQLIEAMVAFSIIFLGVELTRSLRGEQGLTIRNPWLIAFGFGLLHGSAFAGALKEVGLPDGNILPALLLFNLGVEVGQLLFVAVVGALILALGRLRLPTAVPRLARGAAAYAIGTFSPFWFFERLHAALTIA